MARNTKVAEFDMTSATEREKYAKLVNQPGVVVDKNSDFFGIGGGGDGEGAYTMLTRLVDYSELEEADDQPVFVPRML